MFPGAGTLINAALVFVGGLIGLCIKKGLKAQLQEALLHASAVASMFLGISGAMAGLLTIADGKLETTGGMLMILSLVIGTFIGELLRLDDRVNALAVWTQKKIKIQENGGRFVEGMVTATLVMCVGAMAIMGAFQDGLNNDPSLLIAKGVLDFVISIVFASSFGAGVLFSIFPLIVYQGGLTLLAQVISPILSEQLTLQLTYIGSVLIFVVGYNLLFSDRKIKVANMLPALLIPVLWEGIQWLWSLL